MGACKAHCSTHGEAQLLPVLLNSLLLTLALQLLLATPLILQARSGQQSSVWVCIALLNLCGCCSGHANQPDIVRLPVAG